MFFRYMLEDVERLDRLINHLLAAARNERQLVNEETEDVEMGPLLKQCVEEVRQTYQSPRDAFRMTIEPGVVRGRRVDLDMIFRNLIDNAVKYAGDPPEVEIISHPAKGNTIVTQIMDNGRGIPLRYRHQIFGRFVRLGSELQREKPGTGLGLYIVHTLVRRMRGKVRVIDREAGMGTMFEVVLPGSPLPPNQSAAVQKSAEEAKQSVVADS
jgi:signal transduction histidine kinase